VPNMVRQSQLTDQGRDRWQSTRSRTSKPVLSQLVSALSNARPAPAKNKGSPPCLGPSRAQGKRHFEKQLLIPAIAAAVPAARVEPQPPDFGSSGSRRLFRG
jgi:hypothetical protein